jgi:hypothetical protein
MAQVLPFLGPGVTLDADAAALVSAAYDNAIGALHDKGQPAIVREVIAKRIGGPGASRRARSGEAVRGCSRRVRLGGRALVLAPSERTGLYVRTDSQPLSTQFPVIRTNANATVA